MLKIFDGNMQANLHTRTQISYIAVSTRCKRDCRSRMSTQPRPHASLHRNYSCGASSPHNTAHSSPNSPSTTTSLGSFANLSVLPAHFPRRTRTGNPSPICHAVNFNPRPKPRERKAPTPHSMDDPRYSTSATSNQTCAIELRILGLP
jgi:hypothetical protein